MTTKKKPVRKKVAKKKVTRKPARKRAPLKVTAPIGRPCDFTPEMGAEICARMINGRSLRNVCKDDDMPDKMTVFRWLAKADMEDSSKEFKEFRYQYDRAVRLRREYRFDEMNETLEDLARIPAIGSDGMPIMDKNNEPVMIMTSQSVAFAKLVQDTFKWQASKEDPKKYGDKVTQEVTGPGGGPLQHIASDMTPEDAAKLYRENLGRRGD